MSEENAKKLRVVRFWVVGVFLIIAAGTIAFGFVIPGLMRELLFWLGLLLAAALCAIWYFGYRAWLAKQA